MARRTQVCNKYVNKLRGSFLGTRENITWYIQCICMYSRKGGESVESSEQAVRLGTMRRDHRPRNSRTEFASHTSWRGNVRTNPKIIRSEFKYQNCNGKMWAYVTCCPPSQSQVAGIGHPARR